MPLTIPKSVWEKCQKYFSDKEKLELHLAVVGESKNPRREFVIDPNGVSRMTLSKVRLHLIGDSSVEGTKVRTSGSGGGVD